MWEASPSPALGRRLCPRVRPLLAAALALGSWGVGAGQPDYRISADPELRALSVCACFPDRLPARLTAGDLDARQHLDSATLERGGRTRTLAAGDGGLVLPPGDGPGCVRYRVDLRASLTDSWHGLGGRGEDAVLVSPHLFLWTPPEGLVGATLSFDLPPGMGLSAPWPPVSEGDRTAAGGGESRFQIGRRPLDWDARVAIGRFDRFSITLPGGRLDVALLRGDPTAARERIEQWLRVNAEALALALDPAAPRLPVARLQVLVVPLGRGGEPVPWGQVMRGGGDAVHLYIDQTRPQAEFLADWVLIHELSHLLHPFTDGDGPWLYEGIASYYQTILPARAGWRDELDTWDALHAGFRRGIKGSKPGQSLAQASRDMLRERGFLRVYWSGAAFALLADLELRRTSGGVRSLDWALGELRRRFGPYDRHWRAREVVDALDRVSGGRVFGELYRRWLPSDGFPDLTEAYRRLGIEVVDDRRLRLHDDPHAAALRAALLGRRSPGDRATGQRGPEVGCDPGETPACPGQTLAREDPDP
jgi:hypothetical protein